MSEKPWRDKARLKRLYVDEGLSQRDISEMFGCGQVTVGRWLKRHNIETRTRGGRPKSEPYKDPEWLKEQYKAKRKSLTDIANEQGVDKESVRFQMHKHGIESRGQGQTAKIHAPLMVSQKGYEVWRNVLGEGGRGGNEHYAVHRLLAISEYGVDAVKEKVVHHKNGIPWDNRPENIEPLSHSEHMQTHHEQGDL